MLVSRRNLLRALGTSALALPLARQRPLRAQAAPGNLLVFFSPNAWVRNYWGAEGAGTTFQLRESLRVLDPYKDNLTVIKGLCSKSPTPIASHEDVVRILTCTGSGPDGSDPGENYLAYGPSIDHHLTRSLGLPPPLTLAPDPELMLQSDPTHWMWRLSWRQDGDKATHDVAKRDPREVYAELFAGVMPTGQSAEATARLLRGQSVLDLVKADLDAMRPGLSALDRGHLDVYEGSLREIERRLSAPTARTCDPSMTEVPADWLGPGDEVERLAANGDVLLDLIGQAFSCGVQRVVTLQWGEAALGVNPARTTRDHHWVTHGNGGGSGDTDLDGDGDIDVRDSNLLCDRWYADRFASCLEKLTALGVLDDTIVVWCSEISQEHNQNNCVWIVAGGRNLGIKLGQYIEYPFSGEEGAQGSARASGRRPENTGIADLWVSVQKAMGVDQDQFGEAAMCQGGLPDLYEG